MMIKLVYVIRKRDDVPTEEFHKYWLESHGPLVRSFAKTLKAKKYVQSHTVLPEQGAMFAASRGMPEGFDGITEVWWDPSEVEGDTPDRLEAGRKLLEDESSFIDFKRSYIFLTEEHTIFDYTK